MLRPEPGTKIADAQEPSSHWLVCDHPDPAYVTVCLVREDPGEVGPEMDWPVNRWRTFLDRHQAPEAAASEGTES